MVQALLINSLRRISERISPKQRGILALSVPIVCTITIFAAWMISRVSTRNAEAWVHHTEELISQSNAVLLALTTLESKVHQDALEGKVFSFDEFEQASRRINQAATSVDQLIRNNPSQQQVWRQVIAIQQQRLDLLQQLLSELQPSRFPGRTQLPVSNLNQGQRSMDRLRQSIETFQATERRLLAARRQRLNMMLQTSTVIGWSLLAGSLLSSFGAMSLFWILDTERTERNLELSHSQQLAAAIADSVVDGVIVTDAQGQVTAFNPSALNVFGYQVEEVRDRPLQDFLETIPPTAEPLDAANSNPDPFLKTQGIRKDGSQFSVEVSISENIAYQQRLLIVRDMTARQAAQQRLEQYATDLEQLNQTLSLTNRTLTSRNRELEQFAYLASHDLKAPLRAIMNLSSWIEEDLDEQLPPDSRDQFQLLRGRVNRMERLIDGLALYASVGQGPIQTESVAVEDMIQDIVQELEPPEHLHIGSDAPLPTIQGDRQYLRQIFVQLIDNAIKFHDGETGRITITAQEKEDQWEFAVIDDGPGIEEVYHQKIFQVFQTLVPRDQFESTGIGLAIVSKILATIGGDIQLDSAAGQGATFKFTWPKLRQGLPIEGGRKL